MVSMEELLVAQTGTGFSAIPRIGTAGLIGFSKKEGLVFELSKCFAFSIGVLRFSSGSTR